MAMEWRRLDDRALSYARGELANGKTLAGLLMPMLEQCEAWALLPPDWDAERPYDFGYGDVNSKLGRDRLLPYATLRHHVEDLDGRNVVIFEDAYAGPDDASIVTGNHFTPVVTMGDEVYQVIGAQEVSPMHLPVCEYPIIGIATSVSADAPPLEDRTEISPELLAALADKAVALIVAAWDAESYVIYDRGLLEAA
jgi:hypothetical protein